MFPEGKHDEPARLVTRVAPLFITGLTSVPISHSGLSGGHIALLRA